MVWIYIKTRTYLIGVAVFLLMFTFIMVRYVAPQQYGAEATEELKSTVTGLSIFDTGSLKDNIFVIAASIVLGISIVYLLLRVVSGFIFIAEK